MPNRPAKRQYKTRARAAKIIQSAIRRRLATGIRRKRSLNKDKVYPYSRYSGNPLTLTVDTVSSGYFATFSLDDVKAYTEFSALYDQFKIKKCQYQITMITNPNAPVPTNNTSVNNPSNWFPKLWFVADPDDNTALTLSEIRERQGVQCRTFFPGKTISLFVAPCVLAQTYKTASTIGYAPRRMWLDVASGYNVPHYGLKYVVDCLGVDPSDTYPFKFRVEIKYWVAFKGVL